MENKEYQDSREYIIEKRLDEMVQKANEALPFGIRRISIVKEDGKKRMVMDIHWWYVPIYYVSKGWYYFRKRIHGLRRR